MTCATHKLHQFMDMRDRARRRSCDLATRLQGRDECRRHEVPERTSQCSFPSGTNSLRKGSALTCAFLRTSICLQKSLQVYKIFYCIAVSFMSKMTSLTALLLLPYSSQQCVLVALPWCAPTGLLSRNAQLPCRLMERTQFLVRGGAGSRCNVHNFSNT